MGKPEHNDKKNSCVPSKKMNMKVLDQMSTKNAVKFYAMEEIMRTLQSLFGLSIVTQGE